jgi:uncharacterized protein (TIGR00369 family)
MSPTIFDSLSLPPAARLLGWKLVSVDPRGGSIAVEFLALEDFTNPSGFVQGGLIAAMLDDTLGPCLFAMTDGKRMAATIDLHVHYLRPVRPGRVTTTGKVVSLGARIAFLEGELFDPEGKLAATAAASVLLTDYPPH